MSDTETAKKLYEYGNRRSVGGNIIRMSFVSDKEKAKLCNLFSNEKCLDWKQQCRS